MSCPIIQLNFATAIRETLAFDPQLAKIEVSNNDRDFIDHRVPALEVICPQEVEFNFLLSDSSQILSQILDT